MHGERVLVIPDVEKGPKDQGEGHRVVREAVGDSLDGESYQRLPLVRQPRRRLVDSGQIWDRRGAGVLGLVRGPGTATERELHLGSGGGGAQVVVEQPMPGGGSRGGVELPPG